MGSQTFNFNRFILLLKAELLQGKRRPLIVGAAAFALMTFLVISLPDKDTGGFEDHEFLNIYYIWYPIFLLLGGFIFTSFSFSELDEKTGAHHYLTLPASTLEKFVSKWFITSIGFAFAFTTAFWIATIIINMLSQAIYGATPYDFSPFNKIEGFETQTTFLFVKIYLAVQTMYLVGAIMFRKYVVFKTPLASLAITLAFAFVMTIIARIVLWNWFDGWFDVGQMNMRPNETLENFFDGRFENLGWFCLWFLLPLWMLTIGFFKLKEKEA